MIEKTNAGLRSLLVKAALSAAAFGLMIQPAWAEKADRDMPANITALGKMERNDLTRITVVTVNALLTKGTLRIEAERLEVREDPEGYQFAVATALPGQLVKFRQKREGVDEYVTGQAVRIEYDSKTETVRFIQNATLWRLICEQKTDESNGELITYDQRTEQYNVAPTAAAGQAATEGKRVRAIIQPKQRDAQGNVVQSKCPKGAAQTLKPSKDGTLTNL